MFTSTTNSTAAGANLSDISQAIAKVKLDAQAMKVDVLCGNINRFIDRLNRAGVALADTVTGTVAGDPKATFAGIPVVENDLLPSDMAVVMLNGEIVQIIRFD